MKLLKKMATVLLAVVLLVTTVGCSSTSVEEKTSEEVTTNQTNENERGDDSLAAEDQLTIDMSETYEVNAFIWGPRDAAPDDEIIKYLNDMFNINLKVERLLSKEYNQALELKIASGDMPDLFRAKTSAPHIYSNLQQDDYLVNFSEYIDKFGYTDLEEYLQKSGMEQFSESDGFYQLPSFRGPTKNAFAFRQDWLDKVGMEEPKTLDEVKAVLEAFRDQKPGGEDTIPLTFTYEFYSPVDQIITLFTGANTWKQVDGQWTYNHILDETKDALAMLNEWYEEGLIDQEVFTQNETQTNAKIVNGTAGMIITGMDRYPITLRENLLATDPNAELSMLVPFPSGPAGTGRLELTGLNNPMLMVKKGREQAFLDRVMMLINYIHTEEGIALLQNGVEGVHYTMDGDTMVRTEAYERDIIPGIGHLLAMYTDYEGANKLLEGIEKENYEDTLKNAVTSPFEVFNNEVTREVQPLIKTVLDQYMIEFITGSKDLETDWDEYVEAMNDVGLDVLTEEITMNASK